MAKTTSRKGFSYVEGSEKVSEFPTKDETAKKQLDELNEGQADFLQAGVVVSTDWTFTANVNSGTGELGSTGEVAESLAWLPDPVVTGALMRAVTAKAAIAKKALSSGSLPAEGKYSAIAFELTPSKWGAAATVSTKAGTEQTTAKLAEENPPATSSGKIQVRQVIVKRSAGPTYAIEGAQKDVRPFVSRREQAYSAKTVLKSGSTESGEASATRPAIAVVTIFLPAKAAALVSVSGVAVTELLNGASEVDARSVTLPLNPGQKWEVAATIGSTQYSHSYLLQ